jgi:hypothetical protein
MNLPLLRVYIQCSHCYARRDCSNKWPKKPRWMSAGKSWGNDVYIGTGRGEQAEMTPHLQTLLILSLSNDACQQKTGELGHVD